MTPKQKAEQRAMEIEREYRSSGVWERLDSFFTTEGEFVIVMENNHLVVKNGADLTTQ